MSLILDLVFPEKTQLCWERGNWDGLSGKASAGGGEPSGVRSGSGGKCKTLSPGPMAAPHPGAGQQGGVVASRNLWTVDKAVSMAVPSCVGSLSCEAPVTRGPSASSSENVARWASPPHLCAEQLPGDQPWPPGLCQDTLLLLTHVSRPARTFNNAPLPGRAQDSASQTI